MKKKSILIFLNLCAFLLLTAIGFCTMPKPDFKAEIRPSVSEINIIPQENALNINTADKEQLMELDGIGEILSDRIIEYRTAHKEFKYPGELILIEGIGRKKFERIMHSITAE